MTRDPSLLAALLLLTLASPSAAQRADTRDWIPLFDGKSLDGWVPKITGYDAGENIGRTFRVEDGVIKFDGQVPDLWTSAKYKDFVLLVDWRFPAAGDSGIYLPGDLPAGS